MRPGQRFFAFIPVFPDDSSEALWAAQAQVNGWGAAIASGWDVTSPDGTVIAKAVALGARQV